MEGGTRLLERTGDVLGAPAPAPVRSVYLPIVRDLVPESLEVFDFAEPAFVTSDRAETNVPTQALYLLNDEGVFAIALAMADRLGAMPGDDPDRIEQAFLLALGRKPRSSEVSAIREFFGDFGDALAQAPAGSVAESRPAAGAGRGQFRERLRQQRERAAGARGRGAGSAAEQNIEPRRLAWASFCQSLFASAEFRYLD